MNTEKYYFVSYFYTKQNGTGFGNIIITVKDGIFNIREIGEHIKVSNEGFTTVVIISFQEIDKNQM